MKYLFIVSKYGDDIQTNGLVLSSVIDELLKDGNEVVCLSESDSMKEYDYKGVKVYSIKQGLHVTLMKKNKFLGKVLEIILELVFYFSYPSFDKSVEKRMYQQINELNKSYHFDYIYAVYRKYSNVGALLKYKKHNPTYKCGVLFFDLLEATKPRYYTNHFYNIICRMQYRKIGSIVDKVFVPNDGKCECWDLLPISKREMLYYPGFIKRHNTDTLHFGSFSKNKTIIMIFAGTLNSTYRNPKPLFEVMKELQRIGYKVNLKLYTKGNCDSLIESAKNSLKLNIIQESPISKEQLLNEYQHADILVNISNHNLKATPSKVFELISTGKPILNIVFDKEDSIKTYFDKYLMAYSIYAFDSIAEQVKDFTVFLENAHDLTEEEYSVVETRFKNNTPYSVYQSIKNI